MAAGLTITDISSVTSQVSTIESQMQSSISSMGSTPTDQQLLTLQQNMQQWSMMVELSATLAKTVSDTMKSIVQKMG